MLLQSMDYLRVVPRPWVSAAGRWIRPVGKNHRRSRSHPQSGGCGQPCHGLTVPLVTKADGSKFSRRPRWSESGSTPRRRPVRLLPVLAQHRRSRHREHAALLRSAPLGEVEQIIAGEENPRAGPARGLGGRTHRPRPRRQTREHIEAASAALFGRGDLDGLPEEILEQATVDVPTVKADPGSALVDALVATQLCASKSAARRADRRGRCLHVNNERVRTSTRCWTRTPALRPMDASAPWKAVDRRGRSRGYAELAARGLPDPLHRP